MHVDKVVSLINKTSNCKIDIGNKTLKHIYFLISLLSLFLVGCSVAPKQKAGSDALAEAICLFEKKIEYGSDNFNECLKNEQQ